MPKLPKNLLSHPKLAQIESWLGQSPTQLWPDAKLSLPKWSASERLLKLIHELGLAGSLTQGLEGAAADLERERHGLELMLKKTGQVQQQRMSRFLLLSNDGSERFYHDAESLLLKNPEILSGAILDYNSEELGQMLTPPKKTAKALMIHERKALERFLLGLVEY